jgi:uncharacterized protein (UPF0276 family)
VGLGWRRELAGSLLLGPDAVSIVEMTAEACSTAASLREASALAELWPVVVHGVKSSLGSAEGADLGRLRHLGDVARRVRAPLVSEHVAFVRAGDIEIGHLTGLPFTREAVAVVARNVARARRELPDVPLLLENVAWSFRWADDAMDEGDFHAEVAAATGCDLLLDVANLYANARNAGRDPVELLGRYPLDRVAMLHVAGGVSERGFYYDTHAHPVPDAVIDLVARVLAIAPRIPIIVERDTAFPPFEELLAEVTRLATLPPGAAPPQSAGGGGRAGASGPVEARSLGDAQRAIAARLSGAQVATDASLSHARTILERKRVDAAMPLLPRFAAQGPVAVALAARCLAGRSRPRAHPAEADALWIAQSAAADPTLGHAARADALVVRARMAPSREGAHPRFAPFVATARLPSGGTRWVFKGLGAKARVRVIDSQGKP